MAQHQEDVSEGDREPEAAFEAVGDTHGTYRGSSGRATLLTTSDGRLAYPGHIPPIVQSPEISRTTAKGGHDKAEATDHDEEGSRQHSESGLVPSTTMTIPPALTDRRNRPALARIWQSDVARRGGRRLSHFRPSAPRAGSSYLNKAIWEGSSLRRESISSSSSSDEDEDGEDDVPGDQTGQTPRPDQLDILTLASTHEDRYRRFNVGNHNYQTSGKVKKDGRLRITVNETANTGYLAKALGAAVNKVAPVKEDDGKIPEIKLTDNAGTSPTSTAAPSIGPRPRLNIVIMVIGSRGDAQPFLKIGKVLKEEYGHRVRIATHPAFREFVERDSGLEFFSVGGDPSELMAFMVKNPGLIPTIDSVKAGDIGKRRAAMAEMFDGFWRACIDATDDEKDTHNLKMMGTKSPFVADAIIANPPSFAHIHCAEALGIPLHLMFTFPYTPTQAFPHPLASIKKSNVDPGYTNFISYPLVEMMVWQGLGDLVNEFRVKTLRLDSMSTLWAPGATYRLHVPYTYLWSPELVPKPADWGNEIGISGFVFLDLASTFKPPKDLGEFLDGGDMPIYIGFGSIVVDDPVSFTQMIFKAVKMAGVRALVSKGWGKLGGDNVPDNIFMLDNIPHDWLFPRVRACVIHGGAGTTAIALKCGLPTMIVPFFGDQHFWGNMVGSAGVGPDPIPYKDLDCEKLAEGIKYCLTDKAREAAKKMAQSIENDGDGAINAVEQFHRQLLAKEAITLRCSILQDQAAAWKLKDSHVKLSPLAADILVGNGLLSWKSLRLIRHMEWNDFQGPGEPVTGAASSIARSVGEVFTGIASVPYRLVRRTTGRRDKKETSPHNDNSKQKSMESGVSDVTRGVERTATAIAKAPADLSLALAQGFHNAPRLYGDDTVRRTPRVTGFRSGLRAARFELVYGIYDGFTGVVRLPVRGARDNGVVGFMKGVGMGLTGLVLKNLAAIVGPVGYTLKGLVKQAGRHKRPDKFIRRARIVQGQREAQELSKQRSKELTQQTIEGWLIMKELCHMIADVENERGLVGQIDRAVLDLDVMFEDIDTASKAVQALKNGESLESVLHPERQERFRDRARKSMSMRRSLNLPRKCREESSRASSHSTQETNPKISDDETGEKSPAAPRNGLAVPAS
ncbi:hypothetical protein G7Z17_g9492 [Cylindrodendrum hubeiense]|uniref:Glycosyltransferase family 28 N-terminal domain-containing protein n=1 Tax=Cylindrodendrum hubeiense TaxID=595255 RepID=A0A9P5H3V4_9HYPO|nr:hypothetical protein G7Z17_g9492 [Cylindrodendrum hubeiense]